ncbi:MAG: ferritin [Firmicutes bacterium]|nr:ferritin [Bacillota bacterium]
MLNKKVSDLLNVQINKEMFSAYLYLDIANYYTFKGLDGFANWFTVQAKEEMDHAIFFMTYLQNNNVEVVLEAIAKPTMSYDSLKKPLEEAFKHEEYITASINSIYEEAVNQKEYRTVQFLQWFVKEQIEEEKNSQDLIQKYDLLENVIYMLDKELALRVYMVPSLVL